MLWRDFVYSLNEISSCNVSSPSLTQQCSKTLQEFKFLAHLTCRVGLKFNQTHLHTQSVLSSSSLIHRFLIKGIENACREPMEKLGYAEFKVGPLGSSPLLFTTRSKIHSHSQIVSPLPKGPLIKKWNNIWPGINEIEMTINTENKPADV